MARRGRESLAGWAVLALLALASCDRGEPPRQVCDRQSLVEPAHRERPVKVSEPKYGATVVVQRGQNVYRIATENGLTALDLAIWNDIGQPYTIYPGQRLRLYPGGQTGVAVKPAVPVARASTSTAPVRPATPSVVVPTASNVSWRWPADGAVVASFASGDPTRQGVDIAGKAKTAIVTPKA